MPTGYTAAIEAGITFEAFVWRCSRAFCAYGNREDPLDKPIPWRVEAEPYHSDEAEKAQRRLSWLNLLTPEQCDAHAEAEYGKEKDAFLRRSREREELRQKYRTMLNAVITWSPPTKDHQGLRDFMREQIETSIRSDCEFEYGAPKLLSGNEWRRREVDAAIKDFDYHTEKYANELKAKAQSNQWIAELRRSLEIRSERNASAVTQQRSEK